MMRLFQLVFDGIIYIQIDKRTTLQSSAISNLFVKYLYIIVIIIIIIIMLYKYINKVV